MYLFSIFMPTSIFLNNKQFIPLYKSKIIQRLIEITSYGEL